MYPMENRCTSVETPLTTRSITAVRLSTRIPTLRGNRSPSVSTLAHDRRPVHPQRGAPGRQPHRGDAPGGQRRLDAGAPVLHRVHARRPALQPVLRLPVDLLVLDAGPRPRRELLLHLHPVSYTHLRAHETRH